MLKWEFLEFQKSILADFRRWKTANLTILMALNFDFWKNVTLENVKITQKFKIKSYSKSQNGSFSNFCNIKNWFHVKKSEWQKNSYISTLCAN